MLRIFLIITVFLVANLTLIKAVFAAPNLEEKSIPANLKPQTAEEIAAELMARKAAEEPFNPKDVKVDIQSLGLDEIDEKNLQVKGEAAKETIKETIKKVVKEDVLKIEALAESKKIEENKIQPQSSEGIDVKKEEEKILSKIQNFLNKNIVEKVSSKKVVETPADKVMQKRKLPVQKRIIAEKKKFETSKQKASAKAKAIEKKARLDKLKREYLIKLEQEKTQARTDEDGFHDDSQEIVPHEKSLSWSSRFVSYETVPAPILDRYRGSDNIHIPTIPTVREKIDLLFSIIRNSNDGDPAAFHAAYQQILIPDIVNESGDTILTYASLFQKYPIMSSILAKGADPDLPNALGHTPLDISIELLDLKSSMLLINMNADVNYVDGFGRTYLMHAARVGFLPMVDLFVSRGVDVNATDDEGFTALSIAYRHKKDVIVKYLLKHGAKTWTKKPYEAKEQNLIRELENKWKGKEKRLKNINEP